MESILRTNFEGTINHINSWSALIYRMDERREYKIVRELERTFQQVIYVYVDHHFCMFVKSNQNGHLNWNRFIVAEDFYLSFSQWKLTWMGRRIAINWINRNLTKYLSFPSDNNGQCHWSLLWFRIVFDFEFFFTISSRYFSRFPSHLKFMCL